VNILYFSVAFAETLLWWALVMQALDGDFDHHMSMAWRLQTAQRVAADNKGGTDVPQVEILRF
jgi:hypothetical protein